MPALEIASVQHSTNSHVFTIFWCIKLNINIDSDSYFRHSVISLSNCYCLCRLLTPTLCRFPFKLSASSLRVRKHSVIIHLQDLRCSSLIKSYVITRPLRLHNCASYIEPVHRRTIYAPRLLSTLSHLHAVALHFVAVFNSLRDLLPLAHAKSKRAPKLVPKSLNTFKICWCW